MSSISAMNADLHCHSVVSDGTLTPEELAQRLRRIGLSTDQNALLRMAIQLQKDGINNLEDLRGISKAEMKSEVAALKLDPVQFEKLFNAVSRL
jgi:predicted metal-dependent phosphoesterase TrpH